MLAIALHCDSEANISKALNKVYNGKSRHISLRNTYIRQVLNDGVVTVVFVRTCNNLVDSLTKTLARGSVNSTMSGMGLKPLPIITSNSNPTFF